MLLREFGPNPQLAAGVIDQKSNPSVVPASPMIAGLRFDELMEFDDSQPQDLFDSSHDVRIFRIFKTRASIQKMFSESDI
jgi:hypothetical protein